MEQQRTEAILQNGSCQAGNANRSVPAKTDALQVNVTAAFQIIEGPYKVPCLLPDDGSAKAQIHKGVGQVHSISVKRWAFRRKPRFCDATGSEIKRTDSYSSASAALDQWP